MYDDIRWKQRLSNYSKAVDNIKNLRTYDIKSLSDLEKEGVIQRFEVTLELAWKTLKDKMEDDGIILDKISPKSIIRQAFQAKYIDNAECWLEMIEDRNVMSHTYDEEKFEEVVNKIILEYIKNFEELIIKLN
jgi:nucleotidyltransferase substrate binding protein (TIGR01987 family)